MDLSNFNINEYRKYIHKIGLEMGMTYEEREESILKILEMGKNQFSVNCKTCGRKFKISSLDHTCKDEDILLSNYTNRSLENKEIPVVYHETLRNDYPLREVNIGVYAYRGLNFLTKEQYETFLSETDGGYLYSERITSWTIKEKSALRFAKVIQKGTFLEDEDRKNIVVDALKSKSNITGYKGVIIRTLLKKDRVLADISDNEFGDYSEDEVILLPGRDNIEIIQTFSNEK